MIVVIPSCIVHCNQTKKTVSIICHHHLNICLHATQSLNMFHPPDHLTCGASQARGSRSNSSGASSSCVRCCWAAGSTDYTGAPCRSFTDPHFPHRPIKPPLLTNTLMLLTLHKLPQPGGSSSARNSPRELSQRLP